MSPEMWQVWMDVFGRSSADHGDPNEARSAATVHHTPRTPERMEMRLRKLLARGESVGYDLGLVFGQIARAMDYRDAGFATLEEYANALLRQRIPSSAWFPTKRTATPVTHGAALAGSW